MVTTHRHTGFPVTKSGRVMGIISLKDAKKVPKEEIDVTRVREVMKTDFTPLKPDQEANIAWKKMLEEGHSRFPVIEDGRMIGILTRSDIMRTLDIRKELEEYKRSGS